MAIEQYTQINNRRGLQQDLPQLSGAELGWSVDTRRLFIGNGTLEEGAPEIGVTEILTEYSDIFSLAGAYSYKGAEAGYTVSTSGSPVFATATYANNASTITVASSSGIRAGLLVIGVGIPTNTFVSTSYDVGSTTVPITNNTTANSVNSITGSTSIGVTFLSGVVQTQATWAAAAATVLIVPGTATAVQPGQLVTGPGIPSNTNVTAKSQLQTTTATTSWGAGVSTITLPGPDDSILVGSRIAGTGIPANAIVTEVQGINITISLATTAASMGADLLTFTYFSITVNQNLGAASTGVLATFVSDTERTLQEKLDDTVSVRDFGAVGDGVTDDTNAINQALNQLYCVQPYDVAEPSAQLVRRALLFPAGNYLISSRLVIPPNATLYGEGMDHSVITMSLTAPADDYVAITGDNYQQIGASIDTATIKSPGVATAPQNIYVRDMSFVNPRAADGKDIFVIDRADNVKLERVGIEGPETTNLRSGIGINIAGEEFSVANPTKNITITGGRFRNLTNAIRDESLTRNTTGDYASQCVTITNNSIANIRRRGIYAASDDFAWVMLNNCFENISLEGIRADSASGATFQNAGQMFSTGQNIFTNTGGGATPVTNVIYFYNKNCVSVGDLFDRTNTEVQNSGFARVYLNTQNSIAFQGTSSIALAQRILNTSQTAVIAAGASSNIAIPGAAGSILDLTFTSRGSNYAANDRPAVTFTGGGFTTPASATTVIGFQLDRANSWITNSGNGYNGNVNVTFSPPQIISSATIVSTQAQWSTGSNVITNIADMSGIQAGGRIAAAGWPSTAVISTVDTLANTVTANAQPTSTAATATAINFNYGLYNQLGARAATGSIGVGYSIISAEISNIGAGYASNIVNAITYTAPDFANVAAANLYYSAANVFPNAVALGQSLDITSQIGANYDSASNIQVRFPAPVTGPANVGYRTATANARWAGGVASVTLLEGGNFDAADSPTVVFSAPDIAEGTAATGDVQLGFPISGITINANGTGYTSYPQVAFVPNPAGNANAYSAAATVYTQVISFALQNPGNTQGSGNGYAVNNIIDFYDLGDTANNFSNANIRVNSIAASVNGLTVTANGSGFSALPVLTIANPNVGTAVANANTTAQVIDIAINQRGAGYDGGDVFTIAQPDNTGTNANVQVANTRANAASIQLNAFSNINAVRLGDISTDPNIYLQTGGVSSGNVIMAISELRLYPEDDGNILVANSNLYTQNQRLQYTILGAGNTIQVANLVVVDVVDVDISNVDAYTNTGPVFTVYAVNSGNTPAELKTRLDAGETIYVNHPNVALGTIVTAIDLSTTYPDGIANITANAPYTGAFGSDRVLFSNVLGQIVGLVPEGNSNANLGIFSAESTGVLFDNNYTSASFATLTKANVLENGINGVLIPSFRPTNVNVIISTGVYTTNGSNSNVQGWINGSLANVSANANGNINYDFFYEINAIGNLNAGNYTIDPLPAKSNVGLANNSALGTGATFDFDYALRDVYITAGGGGYLNAPVATVTGNAVGTTQANVTTSINTTGAVYTATLLASGNYGGYSNTQTNIFNTVAANGTGTGATVNVSMGLLSYDISNTGQGYITTPQVEVSGGGNGNITATLASINGIVRQVNVLTAGTGYTSAPTFIVTGGAANAAGTTTLTANGNIFFSATAPNFGGLGYTSTDGNIAANITYIYNGSPVANLDVGGATGARPVVAANTSNNSILAITLNSGGNGYARAANGSPATARLIFAGPNVIAATSNSSLSTTGNLGNFVLIDQGYGYTQLPNYNITTDGLNGNNAVLGLSLENRGNVFLASLDPGSGYTSAPTVSIAPPGGVDFANRANAIANPPAAQSEPLVIDTRFLTMSEMKYAVRISNATSIYTRSGTINITGGPIANISGATTYIVQSYDDYVQNYPINYANATQQFLTVQNQPGNGIAYITYDNTANNSVMSDGSGYIRFYIDAIVDNN